jgi:hypothetical protein
MEKLFLIDGNNLIHALEELKKLPLDSAVERVVEMACAVSSIEGSKVYIVLDIPSPGVEEERVYSSDVKVVYAGKGKADECIEKLVHQLINEFQIFVVSADYEVQKAIFSKGGFRITPKEFRRICEEGSKEEFKEKGKSFFQRITIEDRLDEETRKKLEEMRRGDYNSDS